MLEDWGTIARKFCPKADESSVSLLQCFNEYR